MRLKQYMLNELKSEFGSGISFIDIDETLFKTFSLIYVMKDDKIIRKLNNQEFNTYELQPDESFDFREFRDAKHFRETSIPLPQTINRVKRMLQNIHIRGSKIIFLTARADFDDKHTFLQTFRDYGIDIDRVYVERAGNLKTGTIAQRKKRIVMKYINTGNYRRVRMIDDNLANIKKFLSLKDEIQEETLNRVREKHNIPEGEDFPVISFYGLLVTPSGKLQEIK